MCFCVHMCTTTYLVYHQRQGGQEPYGDPKWLPLTGQLASGGLRPGGVRQRGCRAPNMALSTISLATLSSTLQTVLVCVRVVSSQLNPFTNCAPQIVRGTADTTTKLTLGALVVQNQVAYLVNSDKGTPSKYVSKGGLESASSAANIDSLAFMVNSDRRNPSILYDGIQPPPHVLWSACLTSSTSQYSPPQPSDYSRTLKEPYQERGNRDTEILYREGKL